MDRIQDQYKLIKEFIEEVREFYEDKRLIDPYIIQQTANYIYMLENMIGE